MNERQRAKLEFEAGLVQQKADRYGNEAAALEHKAREQRRLQQLALDEVGKLREGLVS